MRVEGVELARGEGGEEEREERKAGMKRGKREGERGMRREDIWRR